jgi:ABC-type nitrate/sulfonate/bicarbonate transport system substrate-binding protein
MTIAGIMATPFRIAIGAGLLAAMSIAAQAQDTKITIGGLGQSLSGIAISVMIDKGFDKKHGVAMEYRAFPTLDGAFNALRGEQIHIGSIGTTAAAQFRDKGIPVMMFYPGGRGNSLEVLVKKESPYQTLGDLKDKNIASYAGAAGTGTVLLRVLTKRYFGYDPAATGKLRFGGAALLPTLLDKGDIDAALLFDPVVAKSLASGKYRSIGNLPDIYKEKSGQDFLWVGFTTHDSFAKKNPEALRGFVKAWIETVEYVKRTPSVFDDYLKKMGFDDELVAILRDRISSDYVIGWNQAAIDELRNFAEFSRAVMGPGYLDHFPPEAYSLDYAPK